MKRSIPILLIFSILIFLTGCVERTECQEISAIVEKKEYIPYQTNLSMMGIIPIFEDIPEQYLITISYENMTSVINNPELYNRVEPGDRISAFLCKGYDKNNKLVTQYLSL